MHPMTYFSGEIAKEGIYVDEEGGVRILGIELL